MWLQGFQTLGIVAGALLAVWALLGKMGREVALHLKEEFRSEFASKSDVNRIEEKLDQVLLMDHQSASWRTKAR